MLITWDCETTTKWKGAPLTKSNWMVSYAIKFDDRPATFNYHSDIEFLKQLREGISKAKLIVGFNLKFETHWARRYGILPPTGVRIWDCQIAEFLMRGQQGSYPSLDESLERFGLPKKIDKIAEYWGLGIDTPDIPKDELEEYNLLDVELTYKLYQAQIKEMSPKLQRLCMVMSLDMLVLEEMEWNGVKLNVELCKQKATETEGELQEITKELLQYSPTPLLNLGSGHHLSCLLYGGAFELTVPDRVETLIYKSGPRKGQEYERTYWKAEVIECPALFTPIKGSQTKLVSKANGIEYPVYSTSEDVLKQLRKPTKRHKTLVDLLLRRAELEKLLSTYYGALPALLEQMEWEDGLIHGQLNQVVARTGRLSASAPNQQNFSSEVDELIVTRF